MATARKRSVKKSSPKKKIAKKRVIRKSPEPLTKLDVHYMTLFEIYKAAKNAGFTDDQAWWMTTEKAAMPDWIVGDGGIIPNIDPDEEEEID